MRDPGSKPYVSPPILEKALESSEAPAVTRIVMSLRQLELETQRPVLPGCRQPSGEPQAGLQEGQAISTSVLSKADCFLRAPGSSEMTRTSASRQLGS